MFTRLKRLEKSTCLLDAKSVCTQHPDATLSISCERDEETVAKAREVAKHYDYTWMRFRELDNHFQGRISREFPKPLFCFFFFGAEG
jgi:hypothetical protein